MITFAKLEDLKSLCEVESSVFKNDPFALSKSSFKYHLQKNIIYIIVVEDKIAGYILWLKRKRYYRLYSLAIYSDFQGLGLASKLLEYSFENLREKDFSLEVKVSNTKAIKLYEKYNFKIKKNLPHYYEDSDGFLMYKRVVL